MQLWSNKIKKQKATGLVEVIVVIGILSITMVSIMAVTVRSLRQVKKDEISDRAMGLELRSLEFAKSPASLQFPGGLQPGDTKRYSVKTGDTASNSTISLTQSVSTLELTTSNCDTNSEYYVNIPGAPSGEVYCNQVIVEAKTQSGKNYYQIKSRIVYKMPEGFVQKELITFRRD